VPNVARLVKIALKYGSTAYVAGRAAYHKVEPQVKAYKLAEQVDGSIVDWPAADTTYHVVVDRAGEQVVGSFPPAPPSTHEAVLAADPTKRVHHRDHWIHAAKQRARDAGETIKRLTPGVSTGDGHGRSDS
jgi:hypothetical protein